MGTDLCLCTYTGCFDRSFYPRKKRRQYDRSSNPTVTYKNILWSGYSNVLLARRATSRHRMLRLEVVWSTVSRREAERFMLPPGTVAERSQGRLSQFETFRACWEQEDRRKSVREEWALLCGGGGRG